MAQQDGDPKKFFPRSWGCRDPTLTSTPHVPRGSRIPLLRTNPLAFELGRTFVPQA